MAYKPEDKNKIIFGVAMVKIIAKKHEIVLKNLLYLIREFQSLLAQTPSFDFGKQSSKNVDSMLNQLGFRPYQDSDGEKDLIQNNLEMMIIWHLIANMSII